MTRVLVVDDEPQILKALAITLRARQYEVDVADTGARALSLAADRPPDLIVLDLGLPDMDGIQVIQALRGWTTAPILVLSGRSDSSDKVEALDAGADDYITKPFGMAELLARVRAAYRRSGTEPESPRVAIGELTVDLASKRVTDRAGSDIRLTPTEWQLVELLLRSPGKLLTHRYLLTQVWGPNYPEDNDYLRVYLARLRRKLEPQPGRPRFLITEPGMGYRFQP